VSAIGLGAQRLPGSTAGLAIDLSTATLQGLNLIDCEGLEPLVAQGLAAVLSTGQVSRDQLVICAASEPGREGDPLAPVALRRQIKASLGRLGLDCIDLYWLAGVDGVGPDDAHDRLREAFAAMEVAVVQNEIGAYGLSWPGPVLSPGKAVEIARDVLGERHHLRAQKLPADQIDPALLAEAAALGLSTISVGAPVPGTTAALL
jgi:aryl-alcohol dehydrogenase-like predicted oxidoreductase